MGTLWRNWSKRNHSAVNLLNFLWRPQVSWDQQFLKSVFFLWTISSCLTRKSVYYVFLDDSSSGCLNSDPPVYYSFLWGLRPVNCPYLGLLSSKITILAKYSLNSCSLECSKLHNICGAWEFVRNAIFGSHCIILTKSLDNLNFDELLHNLQLGIFIIQWTF